MNWSTQNIAILGYDFYEVRAEIGRIPDFKNTCCETWSLRKMIWRYFFDDPPENLPKRKAEDFGK